MRSLLASILLLIICRANCQITQLNSGTNLRLNYLSVIKNNILIGSGMQYLAKSYNRGDQLVTLTTPGPLINTCSFQRLDTNDLFFVSYGNGTGLYRSYDGGNSWLMRWVTNNLIGGIVFFDTLEAISTEDLFYNYSRTHDGGVTWTTTTTSPVWATTCYNTFEDSTILWGGIGSNSTGAFFLSHDRGHTWPYVWGMGGAPTNFSFLNKDTLVGVSYPLGRSDPTCMFTKTTNGGAAWTNSFAPIQYPTNVVIRSAKECYVIGRDFGDAVIAKTTDLGQNWSTFNTGIAGELTQIAFLDDSTAILTGDHGLLLRWNYKNSVFTGLDDVSNKNLSVTAYPNPVTDKIHIKVDGQQTSVRVVIFDLLGQKVSEQHFNDTTADVDFSHLPAGVYYLKAQSGFRRGTIKVIKDK